MLDRGRWRDYVPRSRHGGAAQAPPDDTSFGAIAQLGERLNGIQEVGGSIPPGSTISHPLALEAPKSLNIIGVSAVR